MKKSPLRKMLEQHGLTQRQLASQIGVTQQAVAKWVHGAPISRRHAQALASVFGDIKVLFPGMVDVNLVAAPPAPRPTRASLLALIEQLREEVEALPGDDDEYDW